jgi:hypothetical protein
MKSNKPVNRFDLEQQIIECWGIIDDLELFEDSPDRKGLAQALSHIYAAKFNRMFKTFEELIENGNIQ